MTDDAAELTRQLAQLKEERDYLLAHTQNLEVELRRVALQPARIRDLELRLADAEARQRRVSVVHMAKWLVLEPDVAARRIYRRLRDGLAWRRHRGLRALRPRDRSSGA